jgi:hypothetical protein
VHAASVVINIRPLKVKARSKAICGESHKLIISIWNKEELLEE